jgi:hypothetical protein
VIREPIGPATHLRVEATADPGSVEPAPAPS